MGIFPPITSSDGWNSPHPKMNGVYNVHSFLGVHKAFPSNFLYFIGTIWTQAYASLKIYRLKKKGNPKVHMSVLYWWGNKRITCCGGIFTMKGRKE